MIIKEEKFSVICLCCVMFLFVKYFFPRMAFPRDPQGVSKVFFLSPTMVATFGKYWSNFPISKKRHQFLMPLVKQPSYLINLIMKNLSVKTLN